MKLYLASGNTHKKKEIQEIFPNHTIFLPKDEGLDFNPEETGQTFFENSYIKAKSLWDLVKTPVIADDSGICVSVLQDKPGIFSARYCGKDRNYGEIELSSSEQNRLLIEETNFIINKKHIQGDIKTIRRCFYVCSMVFYYGDNQFSSIQETMEGYLINSIDQQNGKGGFGYDPIVFLPEFGKTVAELSPKEKNTVSHRGKACTLLSPLLDLVSKKY